MSTTHESSCAGDVLASLSNRQELCTETVLFEINAKGDWFYQSGKLPLKFCKLFASILNRIDDEYFLITPVEKLRVNVAEQALLIVDYQADDNGHYLLQSSIETEHIIEGFDEFIVHDDAVTVILARGVEAKLARACFYRFVNEFIA
ncbi:DUF1285 domain-containing protein [Shewanella sp. 1CM18E]|uniref:DUF1285 domain-containing protein n=1 Tax=Shewanella sp. 1CM18E TaxID=2929169 RepID=UPI0020BFE323|nr:DUF1285 domain-containing protein [Shewanella sp. 1CM18E]MCK8045385.1 DUF1285 domain-containing protein [Shewanella sp. 1CM18E]